MIPFVRKYAAALAVLALSACQARAAGCLLYTSDAADE